MVDGRDAHGGCDLAANSGDATPRDGGDDEDRHSAAANNAWVLRHRRRHPLRPPSRRHISKPFFRTEQPGRCSRRLFPRASDFARASPLPPHPRLTPLASAEILPSSPLSRSVVRDNPTPSTELDEVCLRNGKCGNETNSRPSSRSVAPLLDARGCRRSFPRKSAGGYPYLAPALTHDTHTHTRTQLGSSRAFVEKRVAAAAAGHPSTRRSSAMARHADRAAFIPPPGRQS